MGYKCLLFCRLLVMVNGKKYWVVKEFGEGGNLIRVFILLFVKFMYLVLG